MLNNLLDVLKNGKDRIIYKYNDNYITYYDCYKQVLELSNSLKRQGNGPIVVYGNKCIEQFISILACIVSKRCYIPIDLHMPIARINEIVREANASLIIKNVDCSINIVECLDIDEINKKYNELNYVYENDNDYAYIIFTSGSTGNPKGVPISYHNLSNFIDWVTTLKEFNKCEDLIVLSQASFSFDLSVMDIYFSIYKGSTIVAVDSNDNLNDLLSVIKKEEINFFVMTPSFIKMLLLDNGFNEYNYSFVRYMFFCGECLEVETVNKIRRRFSDIHIINAYGPTEATCCVSLIEINNSMLNYDYIPVGKIDESAVDIFIRDEEIILKGDSVFDGYLNLDSNKCYSYDGFNVYETGDIGKIEDDYLYCLGRKDNQVKYLGYRIELLDIENNLLKIDGIREAVVVCKYKDNSNVVKMIKAFVVVDKDIDDIEIKQELVKMIPRYMIPKVIVILDKMPINNNGKYDRKRLGEL